MRNFFVRHLPSVLLSALLFCAVVTYAAIASAAEAAAAPPGFDWRPLIGEITQALLIPILGFIGAALVQLRPRVLAWLETHTAIKDNAWADGVKNRFLNLISMQVFAAMQTTVDTLKKDLEAGKITPDGYKAELAKLKDNVIAEAKKHATAQGIIGDLHEVLGGSDGVASFAATAVEAVIGGLKAQQGPKLVSATSSIAALATTVTEAPAPSHPQ